MKRVFTAQEMRELAEMIDHGGAFALTDPSAVEANVAMLRQAADNLEREEKREKKYEYGVLPCGINFVYQTRAEADHKQAVLEQSVGFQYPIVRREVGNWEEVE